MIKNKIKYLALPCLAAATLLGCNDEIYPAYENGLYFSEAAPGNQFNQQVETFTVDDEGTVKTLTARLMKAADEDVTVSFTVDESLLQAYNEATGKNFILLPEKYRELDESEVVIPKGSPSAAPVELKVKFFETSNGEEYAIPIRMNYISGPVKITGSADHMLYLLSVPNKQKAIKMRSANWGSTSLNNAKMPKWTFEFWIKVNNIAGYDVSKGWEGQGKGNDPFISARRRIFADGASPFEFGGNAFFCRWWADGIKGIMPTFQIEPGFGNMDSQEWWYPDTWYHLAYTYDGETLTLYKNGEVDVTKGGDKEFSFDSFLFGKNLSYMEVEFAQIRLWNICLNASAIKDGMSRQVANSTEGLYAYWPCSEGEGNVLKDSCAGGFDIQMNGTAQWSENAYNFSHPNSKE